MAMQWSLQGLRPSIRPQSPQGSPVVLDMKTDQMYRPMRQPLFFSDGSIAQPGCEPQLMFDDYRVKLRRPNGRVSWVRVSSDTYRRAVIGRAYTE